MEDFAKNIKAKDLLVVGSVNNSDRYSVFSTRMNGRFHLAKGATSLAKKLRVSPKSVDIINPGRAKMPDYFFNEYLDPIIPVEDQLLFKMGKWAEKNMLKNYVDTVMKRKSNRQVVESIKKDGSLATIEKGYMSVEQLKGAKHYENEMKGIKEKENRLSRDVPKGSYIPFTCFQTGKLYKIFSEKERFDQKKECAREMLKDKNGVGYLKVDGYEDDDENLVKRKHHYFFSTNPGYGKTTFVKKILKRANASQISDVNNWMGVSPHAQFLVMDEYGPTNKLSMHKLKAMTAGDMSAFSGNRKSFGLSFQPRNDAQMILFGHFHLFDVMGRKNLDPESGLRKVTAQEAKILYERFHIYRLDEPGNDGGTEAYEGKLHTYDDRK